GLCLWLSGRRSRNERTAPRRISAFSGRLRLGDRPAAERPQPRRPVRRGSHQPGDVHQIAMNFPADRIRQRALDLGLHLIDLTRVEPSPTPDSYFRWIERGMHGSMSYMARPDRQDRRRDLNVILPGVRSLVIVGMDYRSGAVPEAILSDPARGRIASYAWNLDYHDILTPRLESLAAWLQAESGQAIRQRVYVDTGAILERSHAQQAGLGFIGKNTMLIHPRRGSYFFLG